MATSGRTEAFLGDDYGRQEHGRERVEGSAHCEDEGQMIDSRTIFGQGKEVVIRHGDQTYRLRITRHGKLILNK